MKIRHLEILHAILQTGSVTSAAKYLGISQPSVSSVLQHCEAQLGIQLFERAGGRLKPVPEAVALLPEIREIFRRVDRVRESAKGLAQGRLGKVAVGGTLALANGYLVDAVKQFRSRYPHVDVTIHSLQTPDLLERTIAQEFDFVVCYGPVTNSAVAVEHLTSRPLVCIVPATHPLAERHEVRVEDLHAESLISYVDGDWLRQKVDALFFQGSGVPRFSLQVSQTITAVELVKAGAGIAIVEPFFFDAMKPAGLIAVAVSPLEMLRVEIVRSQTKPPSAAAAAFLGILRGLVAAP